MDRYEFKSGVEYYIRQLLKNPIVTTLPEILKKNGFSNPDFLEKLLKRGIISRKETIKSDGAEQFQIMYHVNDSPEAKIKSLYDELFPKKIDESVFKDEDKMKKDILNDKKSGKDYKSRGGIKEATSCGGAMGTGAFLSDGSSDAEGSNPHAGMFDTPVAGIIRKTTLYITERQAEKLREKVLEEEAVMDSPIGNFGYDAPVFGDKETTARHNGKCGSISVPKHKV